MFHKKKAKIRKTILCCHISATDKNKSEISFKNSLCQRQNNKLVEVWAEVAAVLETSGRLNNNDLIHRFSSWWWKSLTSESSHFLLCWVAHEQFVRKADKIKHDN